MIQCFGGLRQACDTCGRLAAMPSMKLELTPWCSDKPAMQEGFPMRKWNVEIYLLDQQGKQHKADCFQKVVYNLHPSFENPVQSESCPRQTPHSCWGY